MNSIDVAPNMQALRAGRAFALIAYRVFLTPEEEGAFRSSLRTGWAVDADFRRQLVRMLAANAGGMAYLRDVLGNDPEAQAELGKLEKSGAQ
jgi:hypothetical protein